jgi:hypothetical protein
MISARCHWILIALLAGFPGWVSAQMIVPGSGQKFIKIGDDFEDEAWSYIFNNPKCTEENDKQQRLPAGRSTNGRWYEGMMRGQPDVIRRVPTPEGGLAGSAGALLMVSKQTGVPGFASYTMQQDDLIVDVASRLGYSVPVSWSPSTVVRVYVPPFEEWEKRNGPSFGFRAACQTHRMKEREKKGRWGGGGMSLQQDTYWPGMFLHFRKGDGKKTQDSAVFSIRGGPSGGDFLGPQVTEPGWWTLGMSFTPNGQIHFFARQGIEDLTSADHISSQYPYGFRCERLEAVFFNVVSGDNGQWSTPWIIDDPMIFHHNTQYADRPANRSR